MAKKSVKIDFLRLNEEFANFESNLKLELEGLDLNNTDNFLIKRIASFCQEMTEREFDNTYLLSISLKIEDYFLITFSSEMEEETQQMVNYGLVDEGFIGRYCIEALKEDPKVFDITKDAMLENTSYLDQREMFRANENIQHLVISPFCLKERILGCIFISLKNENNLESIKKYVTWLNEKLIWFIYSEYNRYKALLDKFRCISRTLEAVDDYQYYHSSSVAELAKLFAFIINKLPGFRERLQGIRPNCEPLNIFQIQLAALCHDLGKINMWEFEDMRTELNTCKRLLHPYFSYFVLNNSGIGNYISDIAGCHHESFIKDGYPFALDLESNEESIETQIIKFVDIIDSSIRERDKHQGQNAQTHRENVDIALNAVKKNKARFSRKVYNLLLDVLNSLSGEGLTHVYWERYKDVISKLGVKTTSNGKQKPFLSTYCSSRFKGTSFVSDIGNIRRNQWIVLFHIREKAGDESLTSNQGTTLDIKSVRYPSESYICDTGEKRRRISMKNKSYSIKVKKYKSDRKYNYYIGSYLVPDNKEYAYSLYYTIKNSLKDESNSICAFVNYNMVYPEISTKIPSEKYSKYFPDVFTDKTKEDLLLEHGKEFSRKIANCLKTMKTMSCSLGSKQGRLLRYDVIAKKWK